MSTAVVVSIGRPLAPQEALAAAIEDYRATRLAREFPFEDHELAHHELLIELAAGRLPRDRRAVILDIGTGRGIIPRALVKTGARVLSLDNPATGGDEPLDAVASAGVEAYECDCSSRRFPVASGSVDCVYLCDVIEHLPHSPRFLLSEIHRVLRQGGICITSTPNAVRLTVRMKMLLGHSNWPQVAGYFDEPVHGGHHHEYTESELRYVHARAGLTVESVEYLENNALHAPAFGMGNAKPVRRLLHTATQIFPGLRSEMFLLARK